MSNFLGNLQVTANGNIVPMAIVAGDTSRDNAVVQATGQSINLIGISQAGPKIAPGLVESLGGSATAYAAQQGDQLEIFTQGDVCLLTIGASAVNPWDPVTADANGLGVKATSGQYFICRPLGGGNPGENIKVLVQFGKV